MSDAWEELFALAEGRGSQPEAHETTTSTGDAAKTVVTKNPSSARASPDERSFKKVRRNNTHSSATELHYGGYLEGRCNPEPLDLEGCRLSRSFLSARNTSVPLCKRWKHPNALHGRCCGRCHRPPGEHVLKLDKEFDDWPNAIKTTTPGSSVRHSATSLMALFVTLRNIRCWSRVYWQSMNNRNHDISISSAPSITQIHNWIQSLPLLWPQALIREGLIREKCLQMEAAAQKLEETATKAGKNSVGDVEKTLTSELMEACIRCIIACDQLYFQLYYLCISNATGNGTATARRIPHPVTYFGEWGDYDNTVATDFFQSIADGKNDMINLLQSHYGNFSKAYEMNHTQHALMALHRLRRNETIALFLGWNPPDLIPKKVSGNASFEERHATLAPSLLQEWRDSCRDFLCHLYCYATVSSQTLVELHSVFLEQIGMQPIVEVGAGTGYMAHLLQQQFPSTTVLPFDVAPATTGNEYHAETPLFTSVQVGTANNYLSTKCFRNKPEPSALLLCYPPPGNPMALHALRNYMQHCEKHKKRSSPPTLIHVGEFKGLTGSEQFEGYLVQHFRCIQRWPCLTWGTDAAEVTLWQRRLPTNSDNSLLLPCSQCHQREAVRRCRWMRSLRYCSGTCCTSHFSVRRRLLSMSLAVEDLPLSVDDDNNFDNEQCYSSL